MCNCEVKMSSSVGRATRVLTKQSSAKQHQPLLTPFNGLRSPTPVPMDIDDFPLDFARSPSQTPPTPVPRIMNDFPDMPFIAEDFLEDFLAPPRPQDFPGSFLEDPTPVDLHVDEPHVVTYKIVKETSIRGRDILCDSVGYSYTVKRCNTNSSSWRCSVRNKSCTCPASLRQEGAVYFPGGRYGKRKPFQISRG